MRRVGVRRLPAASSPQDPRGGGQDIRSEKEVHAESTPWDLGLLYLTNKSIWLVNREKQKTQVDLPCISTIGDIVARGERSTTKFTEVLGADHILNITFVPPDGEKGAGTDVLAQLSAAKDVLMALRDQLTVRAGDGATSSAQKVKLSQRELMRKLSVLLRINISDEEQLSYLLGVDEKELVNLFIERSRLEVAGA